MASGDVRSADARHSARLVSLQVFDLVRTLEIGPKSFRAITVPEIKRVWVNKRCKDKIIVMSKAKQPPSKRAGNLFYEFLIFNFAKKKKIADNTVKEKKQRKEIVGSAQLVD